MFKNLSRFLLFRLGGWKEHVTVSRPQKCIICVAPHTSNWDFIVGKMYYSAIGLTANFLMKKEWFVGPLGKMFRSMGGIAVERSRHTSLTDQLAAKAVEAENFCLAVTPEGTRSRVTHWKKGFYFIALKANLPIMLYAIDYRTRTIRCTHILQPTGNVEADMRLIMDYYRDVPACHPEKFALDEEFA